MTEDFAADVEVVGRIESVPTILEEVLANSGANGFELSVANAGEPMPPVALGRLFHPFYRSAVRKDQEGLGLGLYIAHEIAAAHNGTLTVKSTPEETRFTFWMAST